MTSVSFMIFQALELSPSCCCQLAQVLSLQQLWSPAGLLTCLLVFALVNSGTFSVWSLCCLFVCFYHTVPPGNFLDLHEYIFFKSFLKSTKQKI